MGTVYHVDFNAKKLIDKVSYVNTADSTIDTKIDVPVDGQALEKLEHFSKLFDMGLVQTLINPKIKGVVVPAYLQPEPLITLSWSAKFKLKDLMVDTNGLSATLSFNGSAHYVRIPWKSVCAVFLQKSPNDSIKIWKEDVPEEMSFTDLVK